MTDQLPERAPAWRLLLRKKAAAFALCVIGLTALVSLFAYVLAPDPSRNANRMIPELTAKPPGFHTMLLSVPNDTANMSERAEGSWISGYKIYDQRLPINGYQAAPDGITVFHYIDDGLEDTLHFRWTELGLKRMQDMDRRLRYRSFLLGTDRYGRDILSRLLVGARVSLAVGFIAVSLSMLIGIALGCIAGYYGGWPDRLILWVINIFFAIPTLLLVFALTLTIGKGFWEIFVAIGLTMWVGTARIVRGQVLVIRQLDYITAAKAMGVPDRRIMLQHVLPNIAGPLMVVAAANFAAAILIEAGLSFLGFGVQPPQPSWGLMIKEHYNFLMSNRPVLALIPGLAIMLLVYSFNLLGNAFRDVLDVKGN